MEGQGQGTPSRESPSSEPHKGNPNQFEDEEVVPAGLLHQSVCTGGGALGGGGLSPSPCRLLQTEGAGPVVVTGQELQGPCACRAVSQAADGRSQGGPLSIREAPASASLALPSDLLNPHNHRRRTAHRHRFTDDPSTPQEVKMGCSKSHPQAQNPELGKQTARPHPLITPPDSMGFEKMPQEEVPEPLHPPPQRREAQGSQACVAMNFVIC